MICIPVRAKTSNVDEDEVCGRHGPAWGRGASRGPLLVLITMFVLITTFVLITMFVIDFAQFKSTVPRGFTRNNQSSDSVKNKSRTHILYRRNTRRLGARFLWRHIDQARQDPREHISPCRCLTSMTYAPVLPLPRSGSCPPLRRIRSLFSPTRGRMIECPQLWPNRAQVFQSFLCPGSFEYRR